MPVFFHKGDIQEYNTSIDLLGFVYMYKIVCIHIYVHIYIHIYNCICMYMYMYIYIYCLINPTRTIGVYRFGSRFQTLGPTHDKPIIDSERMRAFYSQHPSSCSRVIKIDLSYILYIYICAVYIYIVYIHYLYIELLITH